MGRWGQYPTDCDQAQDVIDMFMSSFKNYEEDKFYFDYEKEVIKDYLENLTIEQINKNIEEYHCDKENLFALAFLFLEYKAIPKDKEVYEFLYKSLDSNKCCLGFPKAIGLVLLFKKHFDNVISQRYPLEASVLKNIKK